VTSGFIFTVMPSHLFLPLVGWKWIVGAAPIIALYGASANPQLRGFEIHYAIVLVPFLVLGSASGALVLAHRLARRRASVSAASVVLLGTLLVGIGGGGYTLRPWRPEVAAVAHALSSLPAERLVLVQSGLYAHAGYESRVQLLTRESLSDPANLDAIVLLAPHIGAFPIRDQELRELVQWPRVRDLPAGLLAVRNRRD
jgi:hypothetical protein